MSAEYEITTTDEDEAIRWMKIADRRLAQLNAIAQIGAEPADAVLAIIKGEEPGPDAGSADTSTMYHHSVDEFRREMMQSARTWRKIQGPHSQAIHDARENGKRDDIPGAVWDAHVGCMMAGSYAYTIAAVLGVAAREFGPQTARRLADVADDILMNGDDGDRNADVKPGGPLPPPTHAEQREAGQLTIWEAHGAT